MLLASALRAVARLEVFGSSSELTCEPVDSGGGDSGWDSGSFVGAHMLICIYAQSQSKYISVFSFDFILVLLSFHCSHTVPIFSEFFSIFLAILFTSKAYHFDTALSILLPFKRPRSRASCGIKSYYTQRARSLRRAELS